MDLLPASAASHLASLLANERDLASLACTNRAWHQVLAPDNAALWSGLIEKRFGNSAPATSASSALSPWQRWRSLASLKQPVSKLDKIIWLNGNFLREDQDATSTSGAVIRVLQVCWLELGGHMAGVLPGRYRLAWRMRLENNAWLPEASIIARQEPRTGNEQPESGAGTEGALSSVSEVTWQHLTSLSAQAGGGWFEVAGDVFEVPQPCTLQVGFESVMNANWKHGIVFDSVRLVRQPTPAQLQQQQQQQQGGFMGWIMGWLAGLQLM